MIEIRDQFMKSKSNYCRLCDTEKEYNTKDMVIKTDVSGSIAIRCCNDCIREVGNKISEYLGGIDNE